MKDNSLVGQGRLMLCCLLLSMLGLYSCRKEVDTYTKKYVYNQPPPVSNYVLNADFSELDETASYPLHWQVSFPENSIEDLDRENGDLKWQKNSSGDYYVYQQVNLDTNHFYKVSVDCEYNVYDYSAGGLYIMDENFERILGKAERSNSAGSETFEFVFSIENAQVVNLVMGFFGSMNAAIHFKNPRITAYDYAPKVWTSAFSTYLVKNLRLDFSEKRYDLSMQAVSNYVNRVLLANRDGRYYDMDYLFNVLDPGKYPNFIKNLNEISDITTAYCQRSALTLGEILQNEFNIPVQQIHSVENGIGIHQFVEYWNPFMSKWVTIDPYFSIVYKKNNVLLSTNEIKLEELPATIKGFGKYAFTRNYNDVVETWEVTDEVAIDYVYNISYPYGNSWLSIPDPKLTDLTIAPDLP